MLNSITPDAAKAAATFFSRREVLFNALKGTIAAAVATSIIIQATPDSSAQAEATFVPENDYPFFGYEPDSLA